MKKSYINILKSISLSFCILAGVFFPTMFSFLDISNNDRSSMDESDDTFIYSLNGNNYVARYITAENVEDMKKGIDTQINRAKSEYTPIMDEHGTGYALPSSEDLESLIGKVSLLDVVPDYSQKYRASADLSTEIYFPTVGDQGMQGSCSAWANAYYAYGYLEAKNYGWDASSGNPDYLLSPAWAYNIIAAYDYGSIPYEVAQVLVDWGIPTLSAMPYNDMDVNSWGDEIAWREAPYHRPLEYTLITYTGSTTIDIIKSLISAGTPVTIGIDAYQFNPGFADYNYIISSEEYDSSGGLNHAQCFVGYDDSITDDGDVGAFRVVNSWGAGWGDNGYYWLTYDAFSEFAEDPGQVIMYITDRIDYNPDLVATWEFNPAPTRMGDIVTLGVGPYGSAYDLLTPHYDYDPNNVFPDFMALDISQFFPYYIMNNDEFFFLEIGSSISTGIISSFLIERYTAGVLVEMTYESIDVPQSTPGYVTNTFMDFNHEISVSLEVPTNPEIFETYQINATVQNIGINDEVDIELYLYLDGLVINSATYSTLSAGASETIDYLWTPMVYDTFNFTVFAPSIVGEYSEENNFKYSLVTIKFLQNYTMTVGYPYTWIDASGGTELILNDDDYAAIPLPFDFTFYDQSFSTVYLCSNGYLSFYDTMPYQWSNVPFPSGDSSHYYMIAPFWDDIYPPDGGHIYVQSFGTYWVAEWLDVHHISGSLIGSFEVVLYETGGIIFNYDYLDYIDPYDGYTCGLNLGLDIRYYNYYQGLTDSTDDLSILFYLESVEHDLRVTLDTPSAPELGTSYTITAMVQNYGESNESNIDFYLYYDEILVNSTFIPTLSIGASVILTYNWTPTTFRTYNLTTYAPPVINETCISNNRVERLIAIHPIKLFDGMFIDHVFNQVGYGSGPSHVSYSHISGSMFRVEWQVTINGTPYQGYWDVDAQTRVIENSGGDAYFGNNYHAPFWIFSDVSLGDIIPIAVDGEGDHIFNITGDFIYDLSGFGKVDVWILEDLTLPGGIAWYEKTSGILLYGNFYFYGGMVNYIFDFVDTNAPIEYVAFDHDIQVYLEIPLNIKIDNSYIINATVENVGLNDEIDVDLFLYLDELLIDSLTHQNLPVGTSQTIQYVWTPTEYRAYNFTALAPAVPLESYLDNNRKTTITYVIDTKLFDGLYIKYIFGGEGYAYTSNMTYSYYNGRFFYETLNIEYMGSTMSYTWFVDALTRVMSEGSIFGDGFHTPAWIFTNISLYDTIPIAVDGVGDHDFYVARELIYDLPGFGLVEVWELEDLTQPGGIAWYEKSTGILLNGTFLYLIEGELYNYTFDFVDTNVEFIYYIPPSLTINTPESASSWETSTSQDITWTSTGTISNVKIELYKDDVFEMEIIASTPNDGSYTWAIPSGLDDSTQYQIKISDVSNPATYNYSDYFEIYTVIINSLTVTNPDSLTAWETGTSQDITWTSTGTISNVKIELYKGGVFVIVIVASTPNDGSYTLTIPTDLENGIDYQIKISDVSNPATYDESPNFAITSAEISGGGGIPSYNLYIVIGIISTISIILIKKRFKLIK